MERSITVPLVWDEIEPIVDDVPTTPEQKRAARNVGLLLGGMALSYAFVLFGGPAWAGSTLKAVDRIMSVDAYFVLASCIAPSLLCLFVAWKRGR